MLYLVATPIGNLEDFSYRAVRLLQSCDYVLCEDTRHSRTLFNHYGIQTPLRSFHQFNEAKSEDKILEDLRAGKTIGLISDAGTPLISDPGADLVNRCRQEHLPITAIPGPCAVINALLLSGFPTQPFQFIGFLPKKLKELERSLSQALLYQGTTIAYETPHRIEKTLEMVKKKDPERKVCIARELTKHYEECLMGRPEELLLHFQKANPRGEMVLLLSPPLQNIDPYAHLSLEELVSFLEKDLHLTKIQAIKMAAELRGLSKKILYKSFAKDQNKN